MFGKEAEVKQDKVGGVIIPFSILEDPNLTSCEKILYSYIINFQLNSEGCFASHEYIAKRLGFSEPSIKRSIKKLKAYGLIIRVQRGDKVVLESQGIKMIQKDQNDPDEGIKMIQKGDQNDPYIIKNIIKREEEGLSPSTAAPKKLNLTERALIGDPPETDKDKLPEALQELFKSKGRIECFHNVWLSQDEYDRLNQKWSNTELSEQMRHMAEWSISLDASSKTGIPGWKSYRQKRDHAKTINRHLLDGKKKHAA